jgi:hypothetical protein
LVLDLLIYLFFLGGGYIALYQKNKFLYPFGTNSGKLVLDMAQLQLMVLVLYGDNYFSIRFYGLVVRGVAVARRGKVTALNL